MSYGQPTRSPYLLTLNNPVQQYAWGNTAGIAPFIDIPEISGLPAGEVWMSTHRRAPSKACLDNAESGLDTIIAQNPQHWLGPHVAKDFGDLPFLFKVLSAGSPLSLQVHPSQADAQTGYAREEAMGIPLLAPERTFKDPHHKPELAVALTPFLAMAGFRSLEAIQRLMGTELCAMLEWNSLPTGTEAYRELVRRLFTVGNAMRQERQSVLERRAKALACAMDQETRKAGQLVLDLIRLYPSDPGQCAPLVLDILELEPGEGLFIPAGVIHAYVRGSILEIMACSDNVVRAGLTVKHVDVDLLCRILDPIAQPRRIQPRTMSGEHKLGVRHVVWSTPAREFRLERLELGLSEDGASTGSGLPSSTGKTEYPSVSWTPEGPEILLCTKGEARVTTEASHPLPAKSSLFLAGSCPRVLLEGHAEVWRAAVGLPGTAPLWP